MKVHLIILTISLVLFLYLPATLLANDPQKETEDAEFLTDSVAEYPLPLLLMVEKAHEDSILLIRNKLEKLPQNEDLLATLGRLQIRCKKMPDAFSTYSRLIQLNPENYEACLFLGHYYYIRGKNMLNKEDTEFKDIKNPKKMQYASYRDNITKILADEYTAAVKYLELALLMRKSVTVENALHAIYQRISTPDPGKK